MIFFYYSQLYHYERKLGTTTEFWKGCPCLLLYHYERKLGTTTFLVVSVLAAGLYHYERKLGTTTAPDYKPSWY